MSRITGNRRTARRSTLALLCVAQFIDVLSVTIVIVALPAIERDVGFSEGDLQLVASIYALFFGGFLMVSGRAADLYGRRRLFVTGLLLFTAAALACGLVRAPYLLVGARAVQGLGAALAVPAALSLLTTTFAEEPMRARALGIWTATAAGGGAAGLVLGGVITGSVGWPWVFLVTAPIGALSAALAVIVLPPDDAGGGRGNLDLAGAATVTGGLVALILAATRAEHAGLDAVTSSSLAVAVALLACFGVVERRARDPLLPPRAYRSSALVGSATVAFALTAVTSPAGVLGTLYLQKVLGYSAMAAGIALAPFSLAVIAGSFLGSWLMGRIGARRTMAAGLIAIGAGMVLASRIAVDGGLPYLLPAVVIAGCGLGCGAVPSTAAGTAAVDRGTQGLASGLLNTAAQVGTAVGIAGLVTFATARTSAAAGAATPTAAAVVDGYRAALLAGAGVAAAALVAALALVPDRSPRT
jgi:MFS family permease